MAMGPIPNGVKALLAAQGLKISPAAAQKTLPAVLNTITSSS
jgi:hypothetical protein